MSTENVNDEPSTLDGAAGEAATAGAEATKRPQRRSRRATAPATAPLFSAAEPVVVPETTAGGAALGSSGTVAAATSTASRRGRKSEAPSEEAAQAALDEATSGQLDVLAEVEEYRGSAPAAASDRDDDVEKDAAPATKGRTKRASAKTSAATSDRAQDLDVFAAFGQGGPATGDATDDDTDVDGDEDADALEDAEVAGTEEQRLPAAALLFQAPEPRRRARRATSSAPATPQFQSPETAARHEDDVDESDEADENAEAGETRESEGASSRRSGERSARRGQGGRRSGRSQAQAPRAGAEDDDQDDLEGEGVLDGQSETDADERQDGEDGARRRRRRGGRGRRRKGSDNGDNSESSDDSDDSDNSDTADGSGNSEDDADDQNENDDHEENDEHEGGSSSRRRGRRRRGRNGRGGNSAGNGNAEDQGEASEASDEDSSDDDGDDDENGSSSRRRRRRRRSRSDDGGAARARSEVTGLKGSTRLEAKRQRRREGREAGRRRPIVTEAEFLARREAVERQMIVREQDGLNQIAVLEDGMLVEHYVARHTQTSMVGNVYLGRVQNVLPSMEAAFIDIGKSRNAVLYAGEVNWDTAGMNGQPRRIEQALKSGDAVLVQVTKDPIGHKGARLTSQITLAGRYLVLVPSGAMTGISRKLPENERTRLKKILKTIVPEDAGVIVRTAAEGASEQQLKDDVDRLTARWADIQAKAKNTKAAPTLLKGEPELAVRVVRDVFNEDFVSLKVQGGTAWETISSYVTELSPDLADRMHHWTDRQDIFAAHRIDEQLAKGMDRQVYLPSGGSLVIDRTEAMTVVDVNTGKFTGAGGTLEETVTKNNLEAAEEIVRQLRLRDIGGIIVIDFIDMVLESNRDLVLRRLIECLGRDRTRHQVAEVTSLGLVQMTRKRVGQGLVEAFSTECTACHGRGFIVHDHPVEKGEGGDDERDSRRGNRRGGRNRKGDSAQASGNGNGTKDAAAPKVVEDPAEDEATAQAREAVKATLATIAAAAANKHADSETRDNGEEPTSAEVDAAAEAVATLVDEAPPEAVEKAAQAVIDADSEAVEGSGSEGSATENDGAGARTEAAEGTESEEAKAAAKPARGTRSRRATSRATTPAASKPAKAAASKPAKAANAVEEASAPAEEIPSVEETADEKPAEEKPAAPRRRRRAATASGRIEKADEAPSSDAAGDTPAQ